MNTCKRKEFLEKGFKIIKQGLTPEEIKSLEQEVNHLIKRSEEILELPDLAKVGLDNYYKTNQKEIIVVPEADNPQKICRFEYITGFSKLIREVHVKKIKQLIEQIIDTSFVLFKDKCNLKNPEGGAFPPHQDYSAYQYFSPKYYVTAGVMLDDSTLENGCLQVVSDYKEMISSNHKWVDTSLGKMPFLPYYSGGIRNGDIHDEITNPLKWTPVTGKKGDLILFDAFVPHYSQKNHSSKQRRMLFFTFNLQQEGDHYEEYYTFKRKNFINPIFHVSTPTKHQS